MGAMARCPCGIDCVYELTALGLGYFAADMPDIIPCVTLTMVCSCPSELAARSILMPLAYVSYCRRQVLSSSTLMPQCFS